MLLRKMVEIILAECKEPTRQAFWKTVVEGRPVADVAQELGISRDAIYCARSRILCRLRTEFAPFLESEALAPPPENGAD